MTTHPPNPEAAGGDRRLVSARHVFLVGLIGYTVAAFLNAPALAALASRQEVGVRHDWALRAVRPLVLASAWTRLDRPRLALDRILHPPERLELPQLELPPPQQDVPSPTPVVTVTQPTPAIATDRHCVPPARRILRVWIAGDSMAGVFGQTLANLANRTGVVRAAYESRHSTGLTRPDIFDWPARIEQVESLQRPDVTVFVFGANDGERLMYQNHAVSIDSPEWALAYSSRVARVMAAALTGGRRVLWIGMPVMRADSFSRHMRLLNDIFRSEASRHPGVSYVSTWRMFATPAGAYTAYLQGDAGEERLVRETDGIHYTRVGATRLAAIVLPLIQTGCEPESP